MKAAALCLLLCVRVNLLDCSPSKASLTVTPDRSQFYKYESFTVSCDGGGAEEGEEGEGRSGWRVMKRMKDGEVQPCPSSCSVSAAFPFTDSGEYWCQNAQGSTGNSVNITVTAGPVILESPVSPVTEGEDVSLLCRSRVSMTEAHFYKDGVHVASCSTGNLTIRNVSQSDGGVYRCTVSGSKASAESRLSVSAPPADQDPEVPLLSASNLLHLIVASPYLLSTILLGLVCRDERRVLQANEARQPTNDVVMETAI